MDLGQDPTTFEGDTLWDAAERAKLKVGLFGPLQSWPARTFKNGGFYVPDTFSRDAVTDPPAIGRFQEFNLRMTQANYYSPDAPLRLHELIVAGLAVLKRGLSLHSSLQLLRQLGLERFDARQKAARPIMQLLPSFDLYWKLHRRVRPDLSLFFTNHVAAIMHRYWGDAMPGYEFVNPAYQPDDIFATMLWRAMDAADRHIGMIRAEVDRSPASTLIVASGLGQHAVRDDRSALRFVLDDPVALAHALALGRTEAGSAMYPMSSLSLLDGQCALDVATAIGSVRVADGTCLFRDVTPAGHTVQFGIALELDVVANAGLAQLTQMGSNTSIDVPLATLGVKTRKRMGGSNTANHTPEGIAIAYGQGVPRDQGRQKVDLLDMAPSILANLLDVTPPASMLGRPSLFAR